MVDYADRSKVFRVNRHSQRLDEWLRQNPVDNSLGGFFGIALIFEHEIDRKHESHSQRLTSQAVARERDCRTLPVTGNTHKSIFRRYNRKYV